MNDYISREAVWKMLEKAHIISNGEYCGYCTEDIFIDDIPSADVQPVKRGKWIDVTETAVSGKTKDGRELEINIVSGKCSCCQHYAEQVNILPPIMKYSICPHCGANMGG